MSETGISRDDVKWSTPYIWAFYWGTTIMLTIGFGDITPVSPREAILVSLVEMFGVILFAFLINSVHTIMFSVREIKERKNRNLESMNRFMRA